MEEEIGAVRAVILDCARGVLEGHVTPRSGAAALNFIRSELETLAAQLSVFQGLDSQLDDHLLKAPPDLEHDVVLAAERLRRELERTS